MIDMKNSIDLLNKYTDPFSDSAKQLSLEFDAAILNKDVDALRHLRSLKTTTSARQSEH